MQSHQVVVDVGGLKSVCIYGGVPKPQQKSDLRAGAEVNHQTSTEKEFFNLSLTLYHFLSLFLSTSTSHSYFLSLSVSISLSQSQSLSLSISLSIFLSLFLSLPKSLSLSSSLLTVYQVVVATPGRLLDLMEEGALSLSG